MKFAQKWNLPPPPPKIRQGRENSGHRFSLLENLVGYHFLLFFETNFSHLDGDGVLSKSSFYIIF